MEEPLKENRDYGQSLNMAEGRGIEPQFTGPEPVVLPLDDPSVQKLLQFQVKALFPFAKPRTNIKKMTPRHGA